MVLNVLNMLLILMRQHQTMFPKYFFLVQFHRQTGKQICLTTDAIYLDFIVKTNVNKIISEIPFFGAIKVGQILLN